MGIIITFPRHEPDPPIKRDIDNDTAAIMAVMADLPYPSRLLLLTAVMLRVIRQVSSDRLDQWRAAKEFARGLYQEIRR